MKTLLSALSVGLALMVMATSASAVPFSYRFEAVLSHPFATFAAPGDLASITVTLDNGGSSDLSQVWTAAHLQSVAFDINNGAATASFFSPFDGGLLLTAGTFATDALGNVISVPSDWSDRNVTADFIASFPLISSPNWFINGRIPVLFDIRNVTSLELAGLGPVGGPDNRMLDPANWSRVTALPLPPTLLLLLVGLGGVALLRRAHPGSASRPTFLSTAALPAVIR